VRRGLQTLLSSHYAHRISLRLFAMKDPAETAQLPTAEFLTKYDLGKVGGAGNLTPWEHCLMASTCASTNVVTFRRAKTTLSFQRIAPLRSIKKHHLVHCRMLYSCFPSSTVKEICRNARDESWITICTTAVNEPWQSLGSNLNFGISSAWNFRRSEKSANEGFAE